MEDIQEDGKNHNLWMLISILLAVVTIWIVIRKSGNISFHVLMGVIRDAKKGWLCMSVLASALYVILEGTALRILLDSAGYQEGRMHTLVYSTSDFYFSAITPSASGGQPASAFFMMRDGVPGGVAAACLVVNMIMYTLSLIVLGVFILLFRFSSVSGFCRVSKVLIGFGFLALAALAVFFVSMMVMGDKLFDFAERILTWLADRRIVKNFNRKKERIEKSKMDYKACGEMIYKNAWVICKVFFCNLFQRVSQIAVPMFLYLSLGGTARKAVHVFSKQCLITVGYNFIPIPGAMGVSDFLMLDGFTKAMSRDMAFQVEMISRGITFYLCVLLCGILTMLGYIFGRKKTAEHVGSSGRMAGTGKGE